MDLKAIIPGKDKYLGMNTGTQRIEPKAPVVQGPRMTENTSRRDTREAVAYPEMRHGKKDVLESVSFP